MEEITSFINSMAQYNIILTEKQVNQFLKFYEMLIEKNKVMNLTGITDFKEVLIKHFLDSISLVKGKDITKGMKIMDMGTGAGFPGIPLKIAFPDCNIVLLDSLNKRVNFLNEVIDELKLENIKAIHGRAEDYGKDPNYREQFDLCVSRAVAHLATLTEYCMPYVKMNGYFIPYKSGDIDDELHESMNAIKILGGNLVKKVCFTLPETDIERSLLIIKKVKGTSKKYPRPAGKPAKEPII